MGFTELLSEKEQDKSKATMLGIMKQSEQDLMYLLNSLLQLSRIESGAVSLQEEHFTIEEILQRIETNFIVLATQKGLKIELSDKTGYIADFIGDKNKIEHVLNNLVDNALKFTLNGKIIVEIHLDYSTHNKVCLKLIVSDSGIGIPQELYGRIFEKFEQGEHYLKKKYNGAGLGLAIVKQLTEFMGGSIHLSSVVGIGSTFTVYIPIQSSINE